MNSALFINYIIAVIIGLIMGFLSSMPIGAVQLEVAKKAVNGHLMPAIAVAIGSVTSDFIYGFLTLFGLGGFIFHKKIQIGIYIAGILVLLFLFYRSFKEHKHGPQRSQTRLIYKKRLSFLTGFSIAITNPGMIIWWIIGFKIFLDIVSFSEVTYQIKSLYLLSGCAGLVGYLIFIAAILHKVQKSVSDRFIHKMNIVLMAILSIIIVYFLTKVLSIIFNFNLSIL